MPNPAHRATGERPRPGTPTRPAHDHPPDAVTDPAVIGALAALLGGLDPRLRAHVVEALVEHVRRCERTHHIAPPAELRALISAARNGQERPSNAVGADVADAALVPLLLEPDDAARQLGVSERTLRRLERDGEVKAVRIYRSVRFAPEDLEQFVADRRQQGEADVPQ